MATMPRAREDVVPAIARRIGSFRWVICGLLFLAATINYVDRQVIGILKPTLQTQFGWSEIDYSTGESAAGHFWMNQVPLNAALFQDY